MDIDDIFDDEGSSGVGTETSTETPKDSEEPSPGEQARTSTASPPHWGNFFRKEEGVERGGRRLDARESPVEIDAPRIVFKKGISALSHIPVIDGEPNRFQAPSEIREFVLFLSNGQLFLSRDHVTSVNAIDFYYNKIYELFLKMYGKVIRREILPFEEIRRGISQYVGAAQLRSIENSTQQRVLDIVSGAVRSGATDLHLVIRKDKATIYSRINGDLIETTSLSHSEALEIAGTIYGAMMQNSDTSFKKEVWQEGQWKSEMLPPELSNIRESHRPIVGGMTMKLRLQYKQLKSIESLEDMGYSKVQQMMISYMVGRPSGISLISGPMGSAKTTTLMLVLKQIKERFPGKCVASVEDPPEYEIPGVEQSKPPHGTVEEGGGFPGGQKRMLRQDVDAFMLGEIRDLETAKSAIESALTGHPLWSTVHAISATHIFQRLEILGVQRRELYDHTMFGGVIGQRLISKLCPFCKEPVTHVLDKEIWLRKLDSANLSPEGVFMPGGGCDRCVGGYKGATIVAEVVVPDYEYMRLGRDEGFLAQLEYLRTELRIPSMLDHAKTKIRAGIISPVTVEQKVGSLVSNETMNDKMTPDHIAKLQGLDPDEWLR